jgi:hypothetical protein
MQYWVKHWLGAFHLQKQPRQRPIFIFSTRRSGSTLLMEMFYSQPGVTYCDQPLNRWRYHPYQRCLPQPYLGEWIQLAAHEEQALFAFFTKLLAGQIRVAAPWNWLHPHYNLCVNRLVLKELNAHRLIDWFANSFDADIVFLVRHPIPTALSILQQHLGNVAAAFLNNHWFTEQYLDTSQVRECYAILENGAPLERYLLEWGLQNLHPLSVCRERTWVTVTYEEMLMRPQQICRLLSTHCHLPDPTRMYQQLCVASNNANNSSRRDIRQHDGSYLVNRWRTHLDRGEVDSAMHVVNSLLGIHAYRGDSPYPAAMLCHFGPLPE